MCRRDFGCFGSSGGGGSVLGVLAIAAAAVLWVRHDSTGEPKCVICDEGHEDSCYDKRPKNATLPRYAIDERHNQDALEVEVPKYPANCDFVSQKQQRILPTPYVGVLLSNLEMTYHVSSK
ncbi:hypothetical protein ACH5RR_018149 [Cinchona calisaya]|uniref:Uncharacterized protein n=1 Tax=Cinchona calisaya TaxID=153742 RepID=A0ABD2ZNS7_9GENT